MLKLQTKLVNENIKQDRELRDKRFRLSLALGCLSKLVSPVTRNKLQYGVSGNITIAMTMPLAQQIIDLAESENLSQYEGSKPCPQCQFNAWFVEEGKKKCAVCEHKNRANNMQYRFECVKTAVIDVMSKDTAERREKLLRIL